MKPKLVLADMDKAFVADQTTKDIRMIGGDQAVNQSLDLAFTYNYRIGKGFTNFLIDKVFMDLNTKTIIDVKQDVLQELEENFQFLTVENLQVYLKPDVREIHILLEWSLTNYDLEGTYKRIWKQLNEE